MKKIYIPNNTPEGYINQFLLHYQEVPNKLIQYWFPTSACTNYEDFPSDLHRKNFNAVKKIYKAKSLWFRYLVLNDISQRLEIKHSKEAKKYESFAQVDISLFTLLKKMAVSNEVETRCPNLFKVWTIDSLFCNHILQQCEQELRNNGILGNEPLRKGMTKQAMYKATQLMSEYAQDPIGNTFYKKDSKGNLTRIKDITGINLNKIEIAPIESVRIPREITFETLEEFISIKDFILKLGNCQKDQSVIDAWKDFHRAENAMARTIERSKEFQALSIIKKDYKGWILSAE
ncbi:hypothetical protein Syn7502_01485 [Synechococcus sp. PCC 7502]|uniref:hypothetical protein n=1 Tax=Synechococcus sp. PCC 7502 TaxID=1173263 RepID=UPI00029F9FF1|nr:hypothetical protein [Synechococcus sp. PCC 7502]AFY73553.1 hypothetical protein Syn7502_01485 [Synechococcus sp. PCC 7502]